MRRDVCQGDDRRARNLEKNDTPRRARSSCIPRIIPSMRNVARRAAWSVQGLLQLLSALYATRFIRPRESRVPKRRKLRASSLRPFNAAPVTKLLCNCDSSPAKFQPSDAGVHLLPLRVASSPLPRLSASLGSFGFLRSPNFIALNTDKILADIEEKKKGVYFNS